MGAAAVKHEDISVARKNRATPPRELLSSLGFAAASYCSRTPATIQPPPPPGAPFPSQRCQEKTGKKCNHLKFKRQGPKNLDDLHVIFVKVHVTGASASSAADISSDESSDDNVALLEKPDDSDEMKLASLKKQKISKKRKQPSMKNEEKEEKSPFLRLYKQTCEKIESGVEKITSSVQASSAPPAINLVPTISEVMKLVKDCGVKEKTALMHTTLTLIMKPEFREIFNVLETNEGRFDFLEREHEKEMLKRVL